MFNHLDELCHVLVFARLKMEMLFILLGFFFFVNGKKILVTVGLITILITVVMVIM